MSSIEYTGDGGNDVELDPKRCQHVYLEGERAGLQCKGMKGASGYCPPHARQLGLLPPLQPSAAAAPAASSQPESRQELQEAANAAQEMAQLSLSRSAAAWLADPKTQKRLRARWDDILDNGNDAELIRLVKELTDRVEGRAGEAKVEEPVTVPSTLEEIQRMSDDELRAALLELEH